MDYNRSKRPEHSATSHVTSFYTYSRTFNVPHGQAIDLLRRPGKKSYEESRFLPFTIDHFTWDIFKEQTLWKCQHAWEATPLVTSETGT